MRFLIVGILKDSVSKDRCQAISELKDSIRLYIRSISQDSLCNAIENTILGMECVIENGRDSLSIRNAILCYFHTAELHVLFWLMQIASHDIIFIFLHCLES